MEVLGGRPRHGGHKKILEDLGSTFCANATGQWWRGLQRCFYSPERDSYAGGAWRLLQGCV